MKKIKQNTKTSFRIIASIKIFFQILLFISGTAAGFILYVYFYQSHHLSKKTESIIYESF